MSLPEQQEYVNQVSLLNSKILHLEETLRIEEKEVELMENIKFHRENSIKQKNENAADAAAAAAAAADGDASGADGVYDQDISPQGTGDKENSPLKDIVVRFEGSSINFPTNSFTILELQNPSYDVSERHKIRRSPDHEALKL